MQTNSKTGIVTLMAPERRDLEDAVNLTGEDNGLARLGPTAAIREAAKAAYAALVALLVLIDGQTPRAKPDARQRPLPGVGAVKKHKVDLNTPAGIAAYGEAAKIVPGIAPAELVAFLETIEPEKWVEAIKTSLVAPQTPPEGQDDLAGDEMSQSELAAFEEGMGDAEAEHLAAIGHHEAEAGQVDAPKVDGLPDYNPAAAADGAEPDASIREQHRQAEREQNDQAADRQAAEHGAATPGKGKGSKSKR